MTPKVSICIPAYRQTKYLRRTLDSILIQDFDDREIIVSDDSPDSGVEDLVREYTTKTKILYVKNPSALGSPENWNYAISLSSGEYIKILHHDDWLATSTSLSQFVNLLDENPEVGMAFSGVLIDSVSSGRQRIHRASRRQISRLHIEPTSLFLGNFIGPPSATIIRRNAFIPYDKRLIWVVDMAQYMDVIAVAGFASTDRPLIINTAGDGGQITSRCVDNPSLNVYEHLYLFEKIAARVPPARLNYYISHLIHVMYSSGIGSVTELRLTGYAGPIPEEVTREMNRSRYSQVWASAKYNFLRNMEKLRNVIEG